MDEARWSELTERWEARDRRWEARDRRWEKEDRRRDEFMRDMRKQTELLEARSVAAINEMQMEMRAGREAMMRMLDRLGEGPTPQS